MEQIFYYLFGQITNILLFRRRFWLTLRYRVDNRMGIEGFCCSRFYFIVITAFFYRLLTAVC